MGKHRKPTSHHTRTVLVVTAPIVGLPITAGTAHALDWTDVGPALAHCESGNNPRARNPASSASGTYQLLRSTWLANGGGAFARTAAQATPAQQETVAKRLFLRAGTTPWNASRSCWRHRIGKTSPKPVPAPTGRVYTVVPGDTLSDIAARSGHTWEDLWAENKATIADPARISVGLNINLL